MPNLTTIQLSPPKSWDKFEDICSDLFEEIWGDKNTDRYGSSGQRQNGVDIFGREGKLLCGVQCKKKSTWPAKELTISEINAEVKKALKFKPPLDQYIIATTAPRDVKATDRANEITEDHKTRGLFSLHIWNWDKIERKLTQYPNLISKHYGDNKIIMKELGELSKSHVLPPDYADAEIQKKLILIINYRYLNSFDTKDQATDLFKELDTGTLQNGSSQIRLNALGWCARLLASFDLPMAEKALIGAQEIDKTDGTTIIAKAFITAEKGDQKSALASLYILGTAAARSASLTIIINTTSDDDDSHLAAFQWVETSQLSFTDFDTHGQILLLDWQTDTKKLKEMLSDAKSLTEEDLTVSPILRYIYAMANLKLAAPEELRRELKTVPLDLRDFPLLMTDDALERLRLARWHFEQFYKQCSADGLPQIAAEVEQFALWLKIKNPNSKIQGMADLTQRFAKPENRLRLLKFAIDFRIPNLNILEITREIDRKISLSFNTSMEAALARFYLAFAQKSTSDTADYIERYRKDFVHYIDPITLAQYEIVMLAQSGRIVQAQLLLDSTDQKILNDNDRANLQRIIEEGKGSNAITLRIAQYADTNSLWSLQNLLYKLEENNDHTQIIKYAEIFFDRVPNEGNLSRLVHALYSTGQHKAALDFIEQNLSFVSRSLYLKKIKCHSHYKLGQILEAQSTMRDLANDQSDPDVREINIQLLIACGDWEKLTIVVEGDWEIRDKLSAEQLIRSANLAKLIDSQRLLPLLIAATSRDNPSAELLLSAYYLAVSANLEQDAQEHGWLTRAIELSGDDGPIRRVSLPDIKNLTPNWEEQQEANWNAIKKAEYPLHMAAHLSNISLCQRILIPALGNLDEYDPRQRALVFTQTGIPKPVPHHLKCIILEPTALITIMLLGIYNDLRKAFDKIFIPHTTMEWLFDERQRVLYHQPSQVDKARKIRNLFQHAGIEQFKLDRVADRQLSFNIGKSLAGMIAEANTVEWEKAGKKYVVRSAPVHRIDSFLSEEIDLTQHSDILVSCSGLVEALQEGGKISEEDAKQALTFLGHQEQRWPDEPEIAPNAKLYLGDLSVTYLLPLGILEKAAQAGYQLFIDDGALQHDNQLLKYDETSKKAADHIDRLRRELADGINTGQIHLAPMPMNSDETDDNIRTTRHPSQGILEAPAIVGAIISDDRFFNNYPHAEIHGQDVPILSVSDFLNTLVVNNTLTKQKLWLHRIKMRQAGFMLMDLEADELAAFVKKAKLKNGALIETIELRAIRENIQHAKMHKAANLPNDVSWLIQMRKTIDTVLKAQWNDEIPDDKARVRSEWLLVLGEIPGWVPSYDVAITNEQLEFMFESHIFSLLIPPSDTSEESIKRYWQWIETAILNDLQTNEPATFNKIVKMMSNEIISSIDQFWIKENDSD